VAFAPQHFETFMVLQVIENLLELAGIEPATSSLRILNPVREDATPKKTK
jgi:hypothetical protein